VLIADSDGCTVADRQTYSEDGLRCRRPLRARSQVDGIQR
jgi:hypothetical protein